MRKIILFVLIACCSSATFAEKLTNKDKWAQPSPALKAQGLKLTEITARDPMFVGIPSSIGIFGSETSEASAAPSHYVNVECIDIEGNICPSIDGVHRMRPGKHNTNRFVLVFEEQPKHVGKMRITAWAVGANKNDAISKEIRVVRKAVSNKPKIISK